jgi:hypothetical protein
MCRMMAYRFVHAVFGLCQPVSIEVGRPASIHGSGCARGELRECSTGLKPSTGTPHPCIADPAHPSPPFQRSPKDHLWPVDRSSSRRVRRHIPYGLDRLTAVAIARSRPYTGVITPGSSREEGCRFRFARRRSRNRRSGGKRRLESHLNVTIGTTLGGVCHGA